MAFEGRTIWITGASSGIGEALARALAAQGAKLILSGRRRDALDALAAELGVETLVLPFEATDWAALAPAVDAAWGWRDGVDMLVNNAGISQRSLAVDTSPEVYRAIIDTDLLAPIWLTQLVLPRMVERRQGHIVGISSVAGRAGVVLRTAYCAAKHGLIGYCDALRAEVEQAYGIRVTTVLPGSVRTQVAANALQADGSRRGASDANIDSGMEAGECVRRMLAGIAAGEREILIAEGGEAMVAGMRFTAPDKLFDMLAGAGAKLAEEREGAGAGWRPEPAKV
ncbi:MAG: short-chain dehydrogenase [Sphingomonas sanxanigenens]|uniref:Short-chain dehydrogenase n=1 Tax=Sphingomonas sanxanigenens TaxID=397260 RepID=A0A2W5C1V2_9SPHN|nr:MAG: short-chain dehydrogenase [Sphingomonas sanxanigenens]